MLRLRDWLIYVITPIVVVIAFDQLTKHWANAADIRQDFGLLKFMLHYNRGFMLGSMKDISQLYTIVAPATVGGFTVFLFLAIQYFLPFRSMLLRSGLAVFFAGIMSNIIDRIHYGFVVDFIMLDLPFYRSGVFNPADVIQWLGVAMIGAGYFMSGSLFYPPHQQRGRIWINTRFQLKYCLTLILVGACFSIMAGLLSYTFLRVAVADLSRVSFQQANAYVDSFAIAYLGATLTFLLALFVVGAYLSHRIAGPIKGFENFLEDLLKGNVRQFKLRHNDEFSQFEGLASKFYDHFHDHLGMTAPKIEPGMHAPLFTAETYDGKEIGPDDLLGKKVWLIFFRYAACPLCAVQIDKTKALIHEMQKKGMVILAIYESTPDQFIKAKAGATGDLLKSMNVPLISDPKRKLYKLYRARSSNWVLFHWRTWATYWEASKRNFKHAGSFDGKVGQLPAHILINTSGTVWYSHYGKNFDDHLPEETVRDFLASDAETMLVATTADATESTAAAPVEGAS